MPKDQFDFKQFSIHQDRCSMKVGTDGVLLGAWAEGDRTEDADEASTKTHLLVSTDLHLLDIGAGTGLISLMLAQRFPTAKITAVEIEQEAAAQCKENFEASRWTERLKLIPHSLHDAEILLTEAKAEPFDCIVTNPPFYNATLKPEDEGRAMARHKDSLPADEIAAFAQRWLSATGALSLIYPIDYDSEVMTACITHGLQLSRVCDVLTKIGKPCKRRMAAFARQGAKKPPLIRELLAIRNERGDYTDEYLRLVNDYYLHLQ